MFDLCHPRLLQIREDIYKMLLSIKGANESFSIFFERLVKSRKNIDKLILVDTDVLIEIFDKNSKIGEDCLQKIEEAGEDIALTSLNLHEIGAEKKGNKIPRFDAMIAAIAINRGFKLFTPEFRGFCPVSHAEHSL